MQDLQSPDHTPKPVLLHCPSKIYFFEFVVRVNFVALICSFFISGVHSFESFQVVIIWGNGLSTSLQSQHTPSHIWKLLKLPKWKRHPLREVFFWCSLKGYLHTAIAHLKRIFPWCRLLILMNNDRDARPVGLEPTTSGFGDLRSTNWTKDALVNIIVEYIKNRKVFCERCNPAVQRIVFDLDCVLIVFWFGLCIINNRRG